MLLIMMSVQMVLDGVQDFTKRWTQILMNSCV